MNGQNRHLDNLDTQKSRRSCYEQGTKFYGDPALEAQGTERKEGIDDKERYVIPSIYP